MDWFPLGILLLIVIVFVGFLLNDCFERWCDHREKMAEIAAGLSDDEDDGPAAA